MNQTTKTITRTAVLLALLVVLQTVTKAAGQIVTGSCVNCVLAVGALMLPLGGSLVLAAASPFLAFLLGVGPKLLAIVPAIAVGNLVYVLVLSLLLRKKESAGLPVRLGGLAAASAVKFLTLYLLVVTPLCRGVTLAGKQVETLAAKVCWPQLITALIGGALALVVVPLLKKAQK